MKTQLALYIFVFVFTLAICCVVAAADTDQATNVDQALISQPTVEISQNTVNQAVADTDQVMVDTIQTAAGDDSQPYNTNIDFDEGELIGLEHNTEDDQLELSESFKIVPAFIWVPNSNEGTVSKVDTRTSLELARYRTSPLSYANPSRTTVDLDGNCWVGNRNTGTAVKIGLYENEQYIDRNGNGIIETCHDLDGNGVITPNEVLPWGQDECVLYEIVLIPKKEGTYVPGEYEGTYQRLLESRTKRNRCRFEKQRLDRLLRNHEVLLHRRLHWRNSKDSRRLIGGSYSLRSSNRSKWYSMVFKWRW